MSGHWHENRDGVLIPSSNYNTLCVELREYEVAEPGTHRLKRMKTYREVIKDLNDALDLLEARPGEYGMTASSVSALDWHRIRIPEHFRLACYAQEGQNEGWYIYIDAFGSSGYLEGLFVGKTFEGMDAAYKTACTCAKLLGA